MHLSAVQSLDKQTDYKYSLFLVLCIHVVMFFFIAGAGVIAGSSAVIADSMDFIADAANYGLSIYVLNKSTRIRAWAAVFKTICMLFGVVPIFTYILFRYDTTVLPNHEIMSVTGSCAIVAHIVCVYYLYKCRNGDSNLVSVWVCTVTDLISNLLIIIASFCIMITHSVVPDIIAAILIISIAFFGAIAVLRRAINEIKMSNDAITYS
ncbi:cation transporter [Rickettsiales endosymbiont of Peranema trichophorum]|uniref:cation diffusion facilitator family transporter n=1 Tax=Rickettsiales endosymbiont of Peranema trichophorum TaxID=2486577 RepID=UPI0010E1FC1F|nr:cation diffusion facilitator family transporter [Rickettsiales endosymbiont of Peranema trichophorum]RZI47592.1 cation transporter [Rickettsiales endosymbiont of Peranema trichophorum]